MQMVKHKNVIALFEIYDEPKKMHLVMELVRGGGDMAQGGVREGEGGVREGEGGVREGEETPRTPGARVAENGVFGGLRLCPAKSPTLGLAVEAQARSGMASLEEGFMVMGVQRSSFWGILASAPAPAPSEWRGHRAVTAASALALSPASAQGAPISSQLPRIALPYDGCAAHAGDGRRAL